MLRYLLLYCCILTAWSAESQTLILAGSHAIPHFNSTVNPDYFYDVARDGKNGNISLIGNNAWCEIPYAEGSLNSFSNKNAFIAPTKGFTLTALCSTAKGVAVYNAAANTIMQEHKKFSFSPHDAPKSVSALCYHKGDFFLFEANSKQLLLVKTTGASANITLRTHLSPAITSLSSDGSHIWASDNNNIYRLGLDYSIAKRYTCPKNISGICALKDGSFIAIGLEEKILYRFVIPEE